MNQVPFTIVGVEPEGFTGTEVGRPYDVSIPMRTFELLTEGEPRWNSASTTWIYVMGRLAPGVSIAQAQAETDAIFKQAGLAAAYFAVRLIETQLFGVVPHDPATLAAAVVILLATAFVAAYLPAHRTSRIDPLTALRHE